MSDIFVSYTSSDRDWAFWIAKELEALGHTPRVHEWEIRGGGDIAAWMEERHHQAHHILCVISKAYLSKPYSSWERRAAQWGATTDRPNFMLPVFIEPCEAPTLLAHVKACHLHGLSESEARVRLSAFLAPNAKPVGAMLYPSGGKFAFIEPASYAARPFPGPHDTFSNVPISVPLHFMGRDEDMIAIEKTLGRYEGRLTIVALYGLRGVGKTTLTAAYAERHRRNYRATWWVRARSEGGMRADLVALGVRLNWVAADEKEDPALAIVLERLLHEGDGILLIYDNAADPDMLKPYLPRGGAARVLVTSNAHTWRGIAEPVEIRLWPNDVGANYLTARTGRAAERAEALALSEVLAGLPLAHEQAAAYCERLDLSFAEYHKRFDAAPSRLLDDTRHAPAEYHSEDQTEGRDRRTVATTFRLAIEEAAKLHPAAEPLIVHAALLAPEPIPLFLFAESQRRFHEPLASALAGDGMDEAVAALRTFALIDRETIPDERNPTIATACIRLHRLVRQVAAARREGDAADSVRRTLVKVVAAAYPGAVYNDPHTWPRARRLDAISLGLVGGDTVLPKGAEKPASYLLNRLASYRQRVLADYAGARLLYERALAIRQQVLGPDHPDTAKSLNDLALLLRAQGDLAGSRPLFDRALAIREKTLGPEHPDTANSLNNLAILLEAQGDLAGAQPFLERALAIRERALGPDHPATARSLNNLAVLLENQGDFAGSRSLKERALGIRERVLGAEHPATARSLNNLAVLLERQGDLVAARAHKERALAIHEKVLGPEHPETARSLNNLGKLLNDQGDLQGARRLLERSLAIREKVLGPEHPDTTYSLNNLAAVLDRQGELLAAQKLTERALAIREKTLGPDHPDTANSLQNLAVLLEGQGDLAAARAHKERALAIHEKVLGPEHPDTARSLNNLAALLENQGDFAGARRLLERSLAIREKALGPEHPDTVASLTHLASLLLRAQTELVKARLLLERALSVREKVYGLDHPITNRARRNLACVLLAIGNPAEALALGEIALTSYGKALGASHAWIKEAAYITADALIALGRAEQASAVRMQYGIDDQSA